MIGVEQKGGTGSSKVHMTNNYTKGDENKIGIFESRDQAQMLANIVICNVLPTLGSRGTHLGMICCICW